MNLYPRTIEQLITGLHTSWATETPRDQPAEEFVIEALARVAVNLTTGTTAERNAAGAYVIELILDGADILTEAEKTPVLQVMRLAEHFTGHHLMLRGFEIKQDYHPFDMHENGPLDALEDMPAGSTLGYDNAETQRRYTHPRRFFRGC